jgi:hypothetical protein
MPDGEAARLRARTRHNLRCIFTDCPAPDIVAVSRARKRDGFSHKAGGGGHAPESVHHLQRKAVIARWLQRQRLREHLEVEAATDTQRQRVAGVLVTFVNGARIARLKFSTRPSRSRNGAPGTSRTNGNESTTSGYSATPTLGTSTSNSEENR